MCWAVKDWPHLFVFFCFFFFLKSLLFHGKNEADCESAVIHAVADTFFSCFFFENPLIGKYVVIFLKTSNSIITCGGTYVVYKDTKAVTRDGSRLKLRCHQPLHNKTILLQGGEVRL